MSQEDTGISGRLASYMAAATFDRLPADVVVQAKHRILDSIAAVVSGSQLAAGRKAAAFTRTQGGVGEASVLGSDLRTSAINAALANAMSAHADETDDFEPVTKAHPGSHVVPAALAMAERNNASGQDLVAAVVMGYDLCCRFLLALQPQLVRGGHRSAEGTSSTMGSVAAAAVIARLDATAMRYALSYAAQQVSGIWSWVRDTDHVEKAFDFSGMGARNGVTAAIMAEMGFTGVRDVFDGEHNALIALSADPVPLRLVEGLGERFFVTETSIKPFSVGYPIQAPLSAFLDLVSQNSLRPEDVERIVVRLPEDGARIVNDRAMPDVNCQHIVALALVDGVVSFESSHDHTRMDDPEVLAVKRRVELVAAPELMDPAAPRSGHVRIVTRDGREMEKFLPHAPGTKENPMTREAVDHKALSLMGPVLGAAKAEELVDRLHRLEQVARVAELAPLWSA